MSTNNLDLSLVAVNQKQKEVIVNEALIALGEKLTETVDVAVSDGANALSAAQVRGHARIVLTGGTAAAAFDVMLPAVKGPILLRNATAHSATVKCTGGSLTVAVAAGAGALIYCDGTDAYGVSGGGGGGGATTFTGLTDTPSGYTGQAGKLVRVNSTEDGLVLTDGDPPAVNEYTDNHTLALGDEIVAMNKATAVSVEVPPASSVAFGIGTSVVVAQLGAGQVTVVAGVGVTIRTPETLKLRKQYAQAALVKIDTDLWLLEGNLEAAA